MLDIPISVLVTAITTLVSGALGAILTNALTARRSIDEKLWELRRAGYGAILAELGAIEVILDLADEYIRENEIRYFGEDVSRMHNENISEHMRLLRRSYTDNYLICSDKFIGIFENLLHSLDSRDLNLMPPEEHEMFSSAVRAARPKLLRQARDEMPVRGAR